MVKNCRRVLLLLLFSAAPLFLFVPVFADEMPGGQFAKHIILFIGDGMQLEHEIAASRYLTGKDNSLSFHSFPTQLHVTTWDINTYNEYADKSNAPHYDPAHFDPNIGYDPSRGGARPYPLARDGRESYFLEYPASDPEHRNGRGPATDSASSATAFATGNKTESGNIAWLAGDAPGGSVDSIAALMRQQHGAAIGVISTVPFNHATPAAFVSHNTARGNYFTGYKGYAGMGIADEIIKITRPDVVIGGGHPLWGNPDNVVDKGFMSRSLYEELSHMHEYAFIERIEGSDCRDALNKTAARAVIEGRRLFGLFGGEGGNFETPVPAHDPGNPHIDRATNENPLLAEAVTSALDVLALDHNGFFLLAEQGDIDWANHANDYKWMIGTVWDLHQAVQAAVDFVDRPNDGLDWSNTLIIVTADHSNSFMRLNGDKPLGAGELPVQDCASGLCRYPDGSVSYGARGHTNELVMLYARGDAAALFEQYRGQRYPGTDIIDNTNIFDVMAQAAGLQVGQTVSRSTR